MMELFSNYDDTSESIVENNSQKSDMSSLKTLENKILEDLYQKNLDNENPKSPYFLTKDLEAEFQKNNIIDKTDDICFAMLIEYESMYNKKKLVEINSLVSNNDELSHKNVKLKSKNTYAERFWSEEEKNCISTIMKDMADKNLTFKTQTEALSSIKKEMGNNRSQNGLKSVICSDKNLKLALLSLIPSAKEYTAREDPPSSTCLIDKRKRGKYTPETIVDNPEGNLN